mmetsp:Transcript_53394/g.125583  ORF Transcript_53394/g.125583 Transcript_53394/m.125583 type:complete len:107 (-) Transcript_53394:37-357(-)
MVVSVDRYPNPESHCWQQTNGDSIVIHRSDRFFQEGYYYLGVMGLTDAWFVVLAQWTDRQRLQSPKPLGRPVPVLAKIKEQFIDTTVRQLPDNLQDKAVDMIRTWR